MLARLFSAIALCVIALLSAPCKALADTGQIYNITVVDDSGSNRYFIQRQFAQTLLVEEASTTGSLGSSSLSGTIGDIELSGSAGASSLNNVLRSAANLTVNGTSTSYPLYFNGSSFYGLSGSNTAYIKPPNYGLAASSITGSLGARSLSLGDADGLSLAAQMAARDIAATSNASSTSACALAAFVSLSNSYSFTSNTNYTFRINLPSGVVASSYGVSNQFGLYTMDVGEVNGTRKCLFYVQSVDIQSRYIDVVARSGSTVTASAPLFLTLPDEYGLGVTQASFVAKTDEQTNTLMNTSGSDSVVSNVIGDYSSSDISDSIGIGDALGIASGGFTSMLGQTASGVVSFDGLTLGADYGGFGIPAFSVDIWSWCPSGLANTIKTAFTAVSVVSWAVGMKRFFDRIFHGEQVVSVE